MDFQAAATSRIELLAHDIRFVLGRIDECQLVVSPRFVEALVLAEDRRFLFHLGVDPVSIVRAFFKTCFMAQLQGASTIEAQLFRSLTDRREISVSRKVREAIGAMAISVLRPKLSIALAYLDYAYYGYERMGIRHAASHYSVNLNSSSICDASLMVALIRRPMRHEDNSRTRKLLDRRVAWINRKLETSDSYKQPRWPFFVIDRRMKRL